jgi:hypothetical protein
MTRQEEFEVIMLKRLVDALERIAVALEERNKS